MRTLGKVPLRMSVAVVTALLLSGEGSSLRAQTPTQTLLSYRLPVRRQLLHRRQRRPTSRRRAWRSKAPRASIRRCSSNRNNAPG